MTTHKKEKRHGYTADIMTTHKKEREKSHGYTADKMTTHTQKSDIMTTSKREREREREREKQTNMVTQVTN